MIYFMASVCENDRFLSTILFGKRVLELICLLVPIILIIMSAIEVSKIVFGTEEKASKSAINRVIHKGIAAVGVFFVPTLVSLLLSLLQVVNFNSTACWANANNSAIANFKAARIAEEEAEKEKNALEKEAAEEERKIIAAIREAAREDNEKAAEAAREASRNSTGTATELGARLVQVAQFEYDSIDHSRPLGSPNKYTRAYIGSDYAFAWCAAFVWWCSREASVYPVEVSLKSAAVNEYKNYFEAGKDMTRYEKAQAYGGNYIPKMGDYIFFSWSHSQSNGSHIGLVKGVVGDRVLIIDGNYSKTIKDRSLPLSNGDIIGYGVWE